jgi:hypothetical protein
LGLELPCGYFSCFAPSRAPSFVELYRKQGLAIGYTGDSILNSFSDMDFLALGYLIAAFTPVWGSVALITAIELFLILFMTRWR